MELMKSAIPQPRDCEVATSERGKRASFNGAEGISDIEGKAPKAFGASEWSRGDASDIDGKTERSNLWEHMSQCGQRSEFQVLRP